MAAIVDLISTSAAVLVGVAAVGASSLARALVRSIFSSPRTDSTLIKIDNRWVDVDNPADAMRGRVPCQKDVPDQMTPHDGPVRSRYDSRNGGPDDHG